MTSEHQRGPKPGAFNELNSAGSGVLFEARKALKMSRPALADKIGTTFRAVQSAENRGSVPLGTPAERLLALVIELPADRLTPELETFIAEHKQRYNRLRAIFGE